MRASSKGLFLLFLGITLPLALAVNFVASTMVSDKALAQYLGKDGTDMLKMYLVRSFFAVHS